MRDCKLVEWWILILIVGLTVACGTRVDSGGGSSSAMEARAKAQAAWVANDRVLGNILDGKPFNQDEFVRSVDFFQELTGIQSHDDGTDIGRVPDNDLREDLERWRAWYTVNGSRLYWDEPSGRVLIRKERQP